MIYITEHFNFNTKTLKWSPRTKTLLLYYTTPYFKASIKLFYLLQNNPSLPFATPLFHRMFNSFFTVGFFKSPSNLTTIYQKKLTSTFTQSLHYTALKYLSTKAPLQTYSLTSELAKTHLYTTPLKLSNIFFVQKTYTALLSFLQSILVLNWTQLNLQQSYVLSRHTLLTQDLLLRFYNLYFYKVSNF